MGHYIEVIPYFQDEYKFLSNFWPTPVEYNGALYATAEHAYQAAKFPEDWKKVFYTPGTSAQWAKHTARQNSTLARKDWNWDEVKEQIMLDIVRVKFKVPGMRFLLGQTGHQTLVEGNHWHDVYWGVCDGNCNKRQHKGVAMGWNVLGHILEKVRDENREEYLKNVHL